MKKKLGEILLKEQLITEEQFDQAMEMQALFPNQTIGQLLCNLEFITKTTLGTILDQKDARQELSDILIQHNLLPREQVLQAVERSRHTGISLTQTLLILKLLNEEEIARTPQCRR